MVRKWLLVLTLWLVGCSNTMITATTTSEATHTPAIFSTVLDTTEAPDRSTTAPISPVTPTVPLPTPTNIPDELHLDLVAQTGGGFRSVTLRQETAFIGQGPRLIVVDVSNPSNPRKLGESNLLPGLVNSVIVQDDTAYVTAGEYLLLLEVSDPGNMMVQSQIELPGPGMILVRDNVIYAAGQVGVPYHQLRTIPEFDGYVATVQISEALHVLDVATLPESSVALALSDNTLYVSSGSGAVWHADISKPSEIGDVVRANVGQASSMRVYGNLLLLGGANEVRAYDVTNVDDPQLVWAREETSLGQVYDFTLHENQIYTLGLLEAGDIVSLSGAIEISAALPNPPYLYSQSNLGILIEHNHLYVMERQSLSIYELDTDQPQYSGSYLAMTGGRLAIGGNDLFVTYNGRSRLGVRPEGYVDRYHLPELMLATHNAINTFGQQSELAYAVTWANNRLYIMQDTQVAILDANSFTSMRGIDAQSEIHLPTQMQGPGNVPLPVIDNIIYLYGIVPNSEAGVLRFDTTNSGRPVQLDAITFRDQNLRIAGIAASERWLVVSLYSVLGEQGQDFLLVYDVTGETPLLVTELQLDQEVKEMQISGDLLLAGGGGVIAEIDDLLELYSLPDLSRVAAISIPHIYEIQVFSDLVYVTTWYDNALRVYDISEPINPRSAGAFELPDAAGHIATSHNYVAVGNEEIGIFVLEIAK